MSTAGWVALDLFLFIVFVILVVGNSTRKNRPDRKPEIKP